MPFQTSLVLREGPIQHTPAEKFIAINGTVTMYLDLDQQLRAEVSFADDWKSEVPASLLITIRGLLKEKSDEVETELLYILLHPTLKIKGEYEEASHE